MRTMQAIVIAVNLLVMVLSMAHAGEPAPSGQFPIVDAHGHIGASFKLTEIIEAMDKNGVSKQVVMARAYPGGDSDLPGDDQLALKLAESYPGRFYPLIGMQRPLLTGAHRATRGVIDGQTMRDAWLRKKCRLPPTNRHYAKGYI